MKKVKIHMAPKKMTPDPNWPPVLDEKLLNVFIKAKKEASHPRDLKNLAFWNQARDEINNFIGENFPHLLPRNITVLGDRLNHLRRHSTIHSNKEITSLVHNLFTSLSMVVPNKILQSSGATEQVGGQSSRGRECSYMEYSYDGGQASRREHSHRRDSSRGEPSHQHDLIPEPSLPMPLIASSHPSHLDRILNANLWKRLGIARVPKSRQIYIMLLMTMDEKAGLMDCPLEHVYAMAKNTEKILSRQKRAKSDGDGHNSPVKLELLSLRIVYSQFCIPYLRH